MLFAKDGCFWHIEIKHRKRIYSGFLYNRGEVINVVMEEKFEILIVVMEIVLIIVVMANSVHHDYTVHTI